jgi:predicted transglutaminase-like cysteine proteinase
MRIAGLLAKCAIFLPAFLGLASLAPAHAASSMMTGSVTSQPIGHYEFCRRLPSECNIRPADLRPQRLTREIWLRLQKINLEVNREIQPMNDIDNNGQEEYWEYPTAVGDCEDYVLQKRKDLADSGISLANLLITVVRKQDGEGHAILTVRTDRGDFELDNLTDEIKPWTETGYNYLKRQAIDNTGRWVNIRGEENLLVGSVR